MILGVESYRNEAPSAQCSLTQNRLCLIAATIMSIWMASKTKVGVLLKRVLTAWCMTRIPSR